MDTITHFVLGGCVGEIVSGKDLGKKSIVVGGLSQLIPDIDFVFGIWMTPASNALAHRGVTHSLLFFLLVTPILAWLLQHFWKKMFPFLFWLKVIGLQILIHIFLDAFNVYGTGWFEPVYHLRVSFNTLFVADPLFSLPLGISLIFLLIIKSDDAKRRVISSLSVLCCVLYLGYSLINKSIIERSVKGAIQKHHIPGNSHYLTTPTPFNNFLWYVVVSDSAGNYVAHRSVFDTEDDLDFQFFPRKDSLLTAVSDRKELDKLVRFSQGYYSAALQGDTLVFNDLRFGQMLGWEHPEAGFVFHYYLNPGMDNKLVLQRGRFSGWNRLSVRLFVRRMFAKDPIQTHEDSHSTL